MYCCMRNCLNTCSDCHKKYVVMADVDYFETEYFCFDTKEEAWDCFEQIEKHNVYGGFRFLPKTAVLLKPENGLFSKPDSF